VGKSSTFRRASSLQADPLQDPWEAAVTLAAGAASESTDPNGPSGVDLADEFTLLRGADDDVVDDADDVEAALAEAVGKLDVDDDVDDDPVKEENEDLLNRNGYGPPKG